MRRYFKRIIIAVSIVLIAVSALVASKVTIKYRKDHEGIFLLKGERGGVELTDDLFPEQVHRLIWSMHLPGAKRVSTAGMCSASDHPCTSFEWNEKSGRGFIKTIYPDGKKLVINLGRFLDSFGRATSGLFLGGGLPPSDPDYNIFNKNETGMAYFDGQRYFHIWCNVNEGIVDVANNPIYPATWRFISSEVAENSANDLTLVSRHEVLVNNVPVRIERYLFYQTGDRHVTLVTSFTNVGTSPTLFSYVYGDEPWVGNFGSSAGNVGWLKDQLLLTEKMIDTKKYNYLGMFDYGNPLAGETHSYTGKANFIEWRQDSRPEIAYVANNFGDIPDSTGKAAAPLASPKNRVIALQWGPDILPPGATFAFTISVGMADNDPKTGLPVKPDTRQY
jgi:hypothetical protein